MEKQTLISQIYEILKLEPYLTLKEVANKLNRSYGVVRNSLYYSGSSVRLMREEIIKKHWQRKP